MRDPYYWRNSLLNPTVEFPLDLIDQAGAAILRMAADHSLMAIIM